MYLPLSIIFLKRNKGKIHRVIEQRKNSYYQEFDCICDEAKHNIILILLRA